MLNKLEKDNLEIFVLAILSSSPNYGYKIISDLEPIIKLSESTLYPILKRLSKSKDLESYNVETNGRVRKYYRITKKGIDRVERFVKDLDDLRNIFNKLLKKP